MFYPHPCEKLNTAFKRMPYQGVSPEKAKYLFVSLDANYDRDIERMDIFPDIIEYLKDGVAYWQKKGVHHPFMLPSYRGDGKFFHQSFSRIGLTTLQAGDVCFIELLSVPTYGQSKINVDDLQSMKSHLIRIKDAVESGVAKHVFIPSTVGSLMHKTGLFPWMPAKPKATDSPLKLWATVGETKIHWHYHFSTYGKFEEAKSLQLEMMKKLIEQ